MEILAFPCNQFGQQEPSCEADIKSFAEGYGAEYKLFSKIEVNGANTHPLYQFLRTNSELKRADGSVTKISWNFVKFLVDRKGEVVKHYLHRVSPKKVAEDIAVLLSEEE